MEVSRTVSAQALVAFRGNRYSVAPELARADVLVRCRLGGGHLDIATAAGTVIARHALAPGGAGAMVRDHGHVQALEQAAITATGPAAPHRRKQRIPPGSAALAGRLRFASLPAPATLEDFDYDAAPAVDPQLIAELATCRYLENATSVLLIGPPASGRAASPRPWATWPSGTAPTPGSPRPAAPWPTSPAATPTVPGTSASASSPGPPS